MQTGAARALPQPAPAGWNRPVPPSASPPPMHTNSGRRFPFPGALTSLLSRHRFLATFATLSLFMGVSVGLAKINTTLYALHLQVSPWLLGLIAAGQSLGILFTSLPMGFWVERYGAGRLFILGSLAVGGLYVLLPLAPGGLILLGFTVAISAIMPARFVSLNTVFMAALSRIGQERAGWYRATHMAGMFLVGPILGAGIVEAIGFQGGFWLIAAMFLITAIMAPLLFIQHPIQKPATDPAAPMVKARSAILALFAHPEARRLALQEAFVQMLHMYYAFYIVVIAIQYLKQSETAAASLVSLQGSAFILALFWGGRLATRLGRQTSLLAASLLATATLSLGMAQTSHWLWLGGILLGAGLGLLQIQTLTQFAILGQQTGLGRMAGFQAMAGPAGALLGGLLGSFPGQWLGQQTVFLLFVPLCGLLAWSGRPVRAMASHMPKPDSNKGSGT